MCYSFLIFKMFLNAQVQYFKKFFYIFVVVKYIWYKIYHFYHFLNIYFGTKTDT